MDPLPPDIILTAIVISFAVGALLLSICYRVYRDHATDNPQELPVEDDYTSTGELVSMDARTRGDDEEPRAALARLGRLSLPMTSGSPSSRKGSIR